jgi:hypothetical protein
VAAVSRRAAPSADPRYEIVDGELWMEWNGVLAMRADRDGRIMRLEPAPAASRLVADKVALATARAFACRMSGGLAIHASAVAKGGRAIACLGDSGAGKSSAAQEMCESASVEMLADDVLGVRREAGTWWACPTEQLHWLVNEGGTKRAVPAHRPARERAPLVRLVLLRFDGSCPGPRLRRLRGSEAFEGLLEGSLRFDRSTEACREEIDLLADLASVVRVDELVRPPVTAREDVARRLMALLDEGEGA